MRVLVLGGAGFLGRHVVAVLEARGNTVVIGSRRSGPRRPAGGKPQRERRVARFERLTSPDAWAPLLGDVAHVDDGKAPAALRRNRMHRPGGDATDHP